MQITFGEDATYYVGYFLALPLFAIGMVVLIASVWGKRSDSSGEKLPPTQTKVERNNLQTKTTESLIPVQAESPLTPQRLSENNSKAPVSPLPPQFDVHESEPAEDDWASALHEFEGANRRHGLWAKFFAESNGDEAIAKASYLRHRTSEMHEMRVLDKERENRENKLALQRRADKLRHDEMAKAQQRARELELDKIEERLPKGRCPNRNCNALIPLSSEGCRKCGAVFEPGAAWRVVSIDEK